MQYNPMEAAKKGNNTPKIGNITSEYSYTNSQKPLDVSQVLNMVEARIQQAIK